MGECTICGQPAGFLKKSHQACADARADAIDKIPTIFTGYIGLNSAQANPDGLGKAIRNLALKGHIIGSEYQRLIEDGLETAVIAATADRDLSDEDILRIDEINSVLGLKISDINDRTRELLA